MRNTFDAGENPFLNGIFAPIQREMDEAPLRVMAGAVPDDLVGS